MDYFMDYIVDYHVDNKSVYYSINYYHLVNKPGN
jgi:hypothetical protein